MEKPGHLIICAECGVQVGTGHVMRCLALAQAWKLEGGAVTFLIQEGLDEIEQRIRGEGFLLETVPLGIGLDPEAIRRAVVHTGSHLAVLDGYNFNADVQSLLTESGIRVLTIDDYGHATDYPVRWLLNQNVYAVPQMYTQRSAGTRLLLGPAYALLRDEFLSWIGWKRSIPDRARKVLITIGGSDPENASEKVLRSLAFLAHTDKHKELEVTLVVGSGNPHGGSLKASSERSPVPVRIARSVQDMPAWMAWADVAIAGAGVTSYELCYMGLPSLLLIVAENQRRIADRLSEMGIAANAGEAREFRGELFAGQLQALIESSSLRREMSQKAFQLVDGFGSHRVRAALLDRELRLRSVRENDRPLLFQWAHDPVARAVSFHSAAISQERHDRWFAERLVDPNSVIYIGENAAGEPVGIVRFQIKGESAVLSVNVAPEFRRQGWGRELIAMSTHSLYRAGSVRRVEAFVKPENQASVRLFEASGFRRTGVGRVAEQEALLFTWDCGNRTHVH